jgi:hypothetical protein
MTSITTEPVAVATGCHVVSPGRYRNRFCTVFSVSFV